MIYVRRGFGVVVTLLSVVCPVWAQDGDANLLSMPDLTQTKVDDAALAYGEALCGPVAVSNSFVFLAKNGYPELIGGSDLAEGSQISVARALASDRYMGTKPNGGTSKESVLRGVRRYVEERGYAIETLEYRGIEIHYRPDEAPTSTPVPISWLVSSLSTHSGIWLQIGWYVRSEGDYRKKGTHWATLAGYVADERDANGIACLIVHDPSPRAGNEPSNDRVLVRDLSAGTIHGWGLPQPAKGFQVLDGEVWLPDYADTAILEGAIVLRLAD